MTMHDMGCCCVECCNRSRIRINGVFSFETSIGVFTVGPGRDSNGMVSIYSKCDNQTVQLDDADIETLIAALRLHQAQNA